MKPKWDLVALGEVMLRLDPGEGRIHTARSFNVWEGGGEYNVARGLSQCFGLKTALVSAFADNPVGHLLRNLIQAGGVDQSQCQLRSFDGIGREVRNGLNFTERGFGIRAPLGCSDRGHTAASQLKPGDIDFAQIFAEEGAKWFHTGGIFAGLSQTTPLVILEACKAATASGTRISYDLNYRPSLWKSIGGQKAAQEINRKIVATVDLLVGNEEDFTAALGFEVEGSKGHLGELDPASYLKMIQSLKKEFPNIKVVATTLRVAKSSTSNDWSALLVTEDGVFQAPWRRDLEVFDRVGGGDSFASGLIYGLIQGKDPQFCVDCGAAHGALAMTTPGDTSMATRQEVFDAMKMGTARIDR